MATNDELRRQQEMDKLLGNARRYAEQEARDSAANVSRVQQLNAELRDQLGIRDRLSQTEKGQRDLANEVVKAVQMNITELGNVNKLNREIINQENLRLSLVAELEQLTKGLSTQHIAYANELAESLAIQQDLNDEIERLEIKQKNLKDIGGDTRDIQAEIAVIKGQIRKEEEKIAALSGLTRKEVDAIDTATINRLAVVKSLYDAQGDVLATMREEKQIQYEINSLMGVTGSIVEGIGGIMQRIGLRSGIFNDAMEQAKNSMHEMAEDAIRGGEAITKAEIAAEGLRIIMEGVRKAMLDPLTLALALLDGFAQLNKAGVDFARETGGAADEMHGVNSEIATAVDLLGQAVSLTRQIGLNAAALFTPKQLAGISDLVQLLGLSEKGAARLGLIMKTTGKSANDIAESVYDQVEAFNATNKSAIAPKQILDDILDTSEDISLSLGNNPDLLTKAAAAARAFGMSLADVDRIASSLMDFESSIEAELEAQLLGNNKINMAKARQLALNNDLAGLAKELSKQGVTAATFSRMNRIEQEAQAKALGMSREQLAKSLLTQEAMSNMTAEQIARARGVSLEESKRITLQERIQKSMQKLQQAFAPILEALVPVVEMLAAAAQPVLTLLGGLGKVLASVIKLTPVMLALKAATIGFAAVKFTNMIAGLAAGSKGMKGLLAVQKAYNAAEMQHGLLMSTKKLDGRLKAARDLKNLTVVQTAALKAYNVAQKVQNFLVGVGMRIMKGFNAALAFSGQMISKVTKFLKLDTIARGVWNAVTSLGTTLQNTAIGRWIANTVALGANTVAKITNTSATAAQSAANATLAGTQSAVASTGAAAGGGLAAAGAGLGAFGAAAAPAIPILLAIGAALLMASPAIYALGQMVVGLAQVIGGVLMKALEMLPSIIDAVAQGFVTMLGAITLEKIAALLLMGPALASVAFGLGVLTASIFTSLPAIGMLGAIALMGPGLMSAGDGISKMAQGVAKLSEALKSLETAKLEEVKDLIATTAFAAPAVAATGAISSLIQGITGGSDDTTTNAKLDELIEAVKSGANVRVYLDSDDITKRTVIESTSLS